MHQGNRHPERKKNYPDILPNPIPDTILFFCNTIRLTSLSFLHILESVVLELAIFVG